MLSSVAKSGNCCSGRFGAHLWQIPVVQRDNGRDLVLQQHVNQAVIIFDPSLVDVFVCTRGTFSMTIKTKQVMNSRRSKPSLFLPVGKILGQEMEKR